MALALGKTVGELQQSMTQREIRLWISYRNKHGPLGMERRFDRPAAIIGMILSRAYGGKATMKDFMPWGQEEQADEVVSFDQLIDQIGKQVGGVNIGERKPG